jgi:monomeric isocitrate dehydrogenase
VQTFDKIGVDVNNVFNDLLSKLLHDLPMIKDEVWRRVVRVMDHRPDIAMVNSITDY